MDSSSELMSTSGEMETRRRFGGGSSCSKVDLDAEGESISIDSLRDWDPRPSSYSYPGVSVEMGEVSIASSLTGSKGVALGLVDGGAGVEKGGGW